MVSRQAIRRYVWTGAITAVTVTGALYGAGLKSRQEMQKERRPVQEVTPEEQIHQLQEARAKLLTKKAGLERKLAEFQSRNQEPSSEKKLP